MAYTVDLQASAIAKLRAEADDWDDFLAAMAHIRKPFGLGTKYVNFWGALRAYDALPEPIKMLCNVKGNIAFLKPTLH